MIRKLACLALILGLSACTKDHTTKFEPRLLGKWVCTGVKSGEDSMATMVTETLYAPGGDYTALGFMIIVSEGESIAFTSISSGHWRSDGLTLKDKAVQFRTLSAQRDNETMTPSELRAVNDSLRKFALEASTQSIEWTTNDKIILTDSEQTDITQSCERTQIGGKPVNATDTL